MDVFDLFFKLMEAYNVFLFFIIGGSFFLFGLLFFGFFLFWQLKAKKVPARVHALYLAGANSQGRGNNYYPVYEYKTPDGEIHYHQPKNATNYILNKLPGTKKTVFFMKGQPEEISTNNIIWFVVSIFFIIPGILLLWTGFKTAEFDVKFFLFFFGIAGFYFLRTILNSKSKPKSKKLNFLKFLNKSDDTAFKNKTINNSTAAPIQNFKGRLLTDEEINKLVKSSVKNTKIANLILTFVIVVMLGIGAYLYKEMNVRVNTWKPARGEVTNIIAQYSSSDGGKYTYYPQVTFSDSQSIPYTFKDSMGSNPPLYKRGDRVDVLFNPSDPSKAMIDKGWWNWALPLILFGVSLLLFYVLAHSTIVLSGLRRRI